MRGAALIGAGVLVMATGCASEGRAPIVVQDAATAEAEREIRELEAERHRLNRREALISMAQLEQPLSAEERHACVARVHRLAPELLVDREPVVLADLAPDVLRVYDLGAVLDEGPDDAAWLTGIAGHTDEPADGFAALLERTARAVESEAPGRGFVVAAGECLLVLREPEHFEAVEQSLNRHAVVGGGSVRVEAAVFEPDVVAATPTDGEPVWTAPVGTPEQRDAIVAHVPFGRHRGARNTLLIPYVQDFDVQVSAAGACGDPLIGTIETGLVVTADYGPGKDDAPRVLVEAAYAVDPGELPEFTSSLGHDTGPPIRIQIPEIRMGRWSAVLSPDASRQTRIALPDGRTLVLTVVAPDGPVQPTRPAWSRVGPAVGRAALKAGGSPLLLNALTLALRYHEVGRPGGDDVLLHALRDVRGRPFTTRGWIAPGQTVVLAVRAVPEHSEGLTARLAEAGVETAPEHGFLTVEDGALLACVTPESRGVMDRALRMLARTPVGGAPRLTLQSGRTDRAIEATGQPGVAFPLCLDDADQLSFVQDFDAGRAGGRWMLDPIIGVMQLGASVRVHPAAPGGTDDQFVVRVAHAGLADDRVPVFSTHVGHGDTKVSIQLPRVRHRVTSRVVHLARGEKTTIESSLPVAGGRDHRGFTLERHAD